MMLGLIWRLLVGHFSPCRHEWEIHKSVKGVNKDGRYITDEYHLRCKKCGDMKLRSFT